MFRQSASFDPFIDRAFERRMQSQSDLGAENLDSPAIPRLDIGSPAPNRIDSKSHELDAEPEQTTDHLIEIDGQKFWLRGNTVLTACPECAAPMTVRLHIGLADCWRCDCSIEMSQKELTSFWEQVELPVQIEPTSNKATRERAGLAVLPPTAESGPSVATSNAEEELARLTSGSSTAKMLRRAFSSTPAWLVSFLVHLILILILALIVFQQTSVLDSITLSTFVSPERKLGGEIRLVDPTDELVDDLRAANNMELSEEEIRDVVEKAENDAKELLRKVAPRANINEVRKNITTRKGPLASFAARDPRVRSEIVKKEGGTTLTESSVARGLRWLASVQLKDGSWSSKNNRGDSAATALALLPFLGAGQTHESGIYRETVSKGLAWLIAQQKPNGDLRIGVQNNWGMYAHGQATIVLSEAFAMTGDQTLAEPTQLAIDFIQKAQHKEGGWRYAVGQQGDTSVFGWQLMALHSAKAPNIGITVDQDVLTLADYYLDQASAPQATLNSKKLNLQKGSLYSYQPQRRRSPTPTMTAEAILCRFYLGWERDDPRVTGAINWLLKNHPPGKGRPNVYYWYYGTQVFHHYGGSAWEKWNEEMRDLLVNSQTKKGRYAGSWNPSQFQWGAQGGRIYVTSLSVCTLEVYYRHLPLFHPIEFEK